MKIDAPRAYVAFDADTGEWFTQPSWYKSEGGYDGKGAGNQPVRVIREKDWRKILRALRAADRETAP